jgi:hypothetical protein
LWCACFIAELMRYSGSIHNARIDFNENHLRFVLLCSLHTFSLF